MGPVYAETSVINYQLTPCNNPEKIRSQLQLARHRMRERQREREQERSLRQAIRCAALTLWYVDVYTAGVEAAELTAEMKKKCDLKYYINLSTESLSVVMIKDYRISLISHTLLSN